MKWFIKCIKNYVNFTGRARRKEYWFFALFSIIFMIVAIMLDFLLFKTPVGIFYVVCGLFLILPSLAVWVRRLHDTGRSGKMILWYYLAAFVWGIVVFVVGFPYILSIAEPIPVDVSLSMPSIPLIVTYAVGLLGLLVWDIFFLVWLCTAGTVGDNKYGPDPKAVEE